MLFIYFIRYNISFDIYYIVKAFWFSFHLLNFLAKLIYVKSQKLDLNQRLQHCFMASNLLIIIILHLSLPSYLSLSLILYIIHKKIWNLAGWERAGSGRRLEQKP